MYQAMIEAPWTMFDILWNDLFLFVSVSSNALFLIQRYYASYY